MKQVLLRGITWNHSRALPPLVATAQRFEELHSGIRIQWEKRSLHEFGHADLTTLAANFDLLIIDHPMAGDADVTGALIDLFPLLSPDQVEDIEQDSIGPSFASYVYNDRLWALPIDAAAPAASTRPDILDRISRDVPGSWEDLISLARLGYVRMPAFSADLFLNFIGLCVSRGSAVARDPENLVDEAIGAHCLQNLRELASLMTDEIFQMDPIAIYEQMAKGDQIAYCPFAYTYSNYARDGFDTNPIRFANPVSTEEGRPMRTVLGGTGIAISSRCVEQNLALEYSLYVSGRQCQKRLYGICGGQPARRSAWHDPLLNQISDDFFTRTAASIETAYVRPRYPGYVALQELGGEAIAAFLMQRRDTRKTLEQINTLYRTSLKQGLQNV